jgi:hypothetical protein
MTPKTVQVDAAELDRLHRIEARARVLHSLVPGWWWRTPPNRATADVLEGIASVDEALAAQSGGAT